MQPFKFQRFVQIEAKPVIEDLLVAMDEEISLYDQDWYLLLGDPSKKQEGAGKYPIDVNGQTVGWMVGGSKVEELARFLAHMAENRMHTRAMYGEMEALQRQNALLERELVAKKNQLSKK